MTLNDDLPGRLRQYYHSEADLYPADGQLRAVLVRTQAIHPRPSWRAIHSGSGMGPLPWWVLRQPRVVWATLAILTALLMAAAAIVGQRPERPPDGSSQAIFVRGYEELEVVAVRVDGQERSLGLIPESVAGTRRPPDEQPERSALFTDGYVLSPTGRLAVGRDVTGDVGEWVFITLGDRSAPVVRVPAPPHGWNSGTWDATGHFVAGDEPLGSAKWFDTATGESKFIRAQHVGDWLSPQRRAGPVTADGEFVWSTIHHSAWILPSAADGSTAGDLVVHQSLGARHVTAAGAKLDRCRNWEAQTCSGLALPDGAVIVSDPAGSVRVAYTDELGPGRTDDAGFASDGQSVWVLLYRDVGGRQAVLARITPEGAATVVASVPLREGMDYELLRIAGMARDDSIVVISVGRHDENGAPGIVSIVVPTAPNGGPPTYHDGTLAGFMPAAAVDAIPGTSFAPGSGE